MTSEDNPPYDQEHITEERSFDQLAKGLSNGTLSRGKALKLLGAALVGGTLASLGIGEAAAARCKRDGRACKKNSQCCSGKCENHKCAPACVSGGGACSTNDDCCSGFGCDSSGFCRPTQAQTA
jgi:hypothetical protein